MSSPPRAGFLPLLTVHYLRPLLWLTLALVLIPVLLFFPWYAVQLYSPSATRHMLTSLGLNNYHMQSVHECLSSRHVVFVGDSITRYQYLSLIFYLEYGRWPKERPRHCLCSERTWVEGWNTFFASSQSTFRGHEYCDCYRNPTWEYWMETMMENRYYRHPTRGTALTYILWVHQIGLRGHWREGWVGKAVGEHDCAPGRCSSPLWRWRGNYSEIFRTVLRDLRPTDLLVNHGAWGVLPPEHYAPLAQAALDAVNQSRGSSRIYWKTTTAPYQPNASVSVDDRAQFEEEAIRTFTAAGALTFDAWDVTRKYARRKEMYWDKVHFVCSVYRELNEALLQLLCPNVTLL